MDAEPFYEWAFPDGTLWSNFYRTATGYLVSFPGLADFTISANGNEVVAFPAPDASDETVHQHESGINLKISGAFIDSGYLTSQVYQFVQGKEGRRIFASKGQSQYGVPIISKFTINRKYNIKIFAIGTDNAKDVIFSRLHIEKPGPGYYHFPEDTTQEYFEGLCSEKGLSTFYKGRPVTIYKKIRPRNEPLDCEVHALAMIELLDPPFAAIKARLTSTREEKTVKRIKQGWVHKWRK